MRKITYVQAIHEALDICLARDKSVFLVGEGVPDPKGIFGTTIGLQKKYGRNRVFDMPISENGLTGVCIGAAISGMRPILVHQRIDFSLLGFEQIVNNAAKWHYMFGGQVSVPLVVRMIIGRGWGQGAQHSQSLQALYGHIPGLKVVMPATAYDAKGMLIAAVEDPNPVIFIEHRWLHELSGDVPKKYYTQRLDKARILQKGKDITLVATSYMTVEGLKAAKVLEKEEISVELVDVRSIKPVDSQTIIDSVKKTGRLLVADTGYKTLGFASEAISQVCQKAFDFLKSPPQMITLPDLPTPTDAKEAEKYYPTYVDIIKITANMLKISPSRTKKIIEENKPRQILPSDIPDSSFTGPF